MGPGQAGQSRPESWRDDVITMREGEEQGNQPYRENNNQTIRRKNEIMQIILLTKQSNGMRYVVGFPILFS